MVLLEYITLHINLHTKLWHWAAGIIKINVIEILLLFISQARCQMSKDNLQLHTAKQQNTELPEYINVLIKYFIIVAIILHLPRT